YVYGHPLDLPSFPTRRSSDLSPMSGPPRTAWRLTCAVLAAVASVLALSVAPLAWIAWGALVPLFVALDRAPRRVTLAVATVYALDRKSTRLNSSHVEISYAVF